MTLKEKSLISQSLFSGRTDLYYKKIYSKENRGSYILVCDNSFKPGCYLKKEVKIKKSCMSCEIKKLPPLTAEVYAEHIDGNIELAVVPLLEDGTTRFSTFDLDNKVPNDPTQYSFVDALKIYESLNHIGIKSYIARSTTAGFHIYLYFQDPYPAAIIKSLMEWVLVESGIQDLIDKKLKRPAEIFPKQDKLDKANVGSGIKIPLIDSMLVKGKNCFVDANNDVIENQWEFAKNIEKNIASDIDAIISKNGISTEKYKAPVPRTDLNSSDIIQNTLGLVGGRKISSGGRNETLTKVAGKLRRAGLSAEAIYEALRVENQEKCEPPLSEAEVLNIARSIGKYGVESPLITAEKTDVGNAERFKHTADGTLLYINELDRWVQSDGSSFIEATKADLTHMAIVTARLTKLAASEIDDGDIRKSYEEYATSLQMKKKLDAMVGLVAGLEGIRVTQAQFDNELDSINTPNGVLCLKSGNLVPHRKGDRFLKVTACSYYEGATAPYWDALLKKIFVDDELIAFIRRALGYSLIGGNKAQVFFNLIGRGNNARSTLMKAVGGALGSYCHYLSPRVILANTNRPIENDLAQLVGKRFVVIPELPQNAVLNENLIKAATGGEPLTAKVNYAEPFTFYPQFTPWIVSNYKPKIKGSDNGIWRRPVCITTTTEISVAERNVNYSDLLMAEKEGIFRFLVAGAMEFFEKGLSIPESIKEENKIYRSQQDLLSSFISEHCEQGKGFTVSPSELLGAYSGFCAEVGTEAPMAGELKVALEGLGFIQGKTGAKGRFWIGLRRKEVPND